MKNVVVIGTGGHAKVIIDIIEKGKDYNIVGLVDRFRNVGERTLDYQVLGKEEDLPMLKERCSLMGLVVAIGDNYARSKVVERVMSICPKLEFVTAIHPHTDWGRDSSAGEGTVIMANVSVDPCVSIGRFCILNTASSIAHDSVMGDFSSFGPRASTGGYCRIGNHTAVAIGVALRDKITIGEHCVIGAGSTVVKDVDSFSVAYGTPAKWIRARKPGDPYLR
jgi:sugar O-acyltransferase (sialic acid O-acetyltransferase NeuD family)